MFFKFSQLLESFSVQNKKKYFLKTNSNFPLTGKCFPLTNFHNGKQTDTKLSFRLLI